VDTYKHNDPDVQQQRDEYLMDELLLDNLLHNEEYREYDEGYDGKKLRNVGTLSSKVLPMGKHGYKHRSVTELPIEMHWAGRWMPDRPGDPTPPPKVLPKNQRQYEYESVTEFPHEMFMGHVSPECDDAKTNLTVDWDHTPAEYTCYGHNIMPSKIMPKIYCEKIPKAYKAAHKCMNQKIKYDDDIPLYGMHRPLWPVYGEYKYVPKQRWLHSLEHGAIVMLYHPCANPLEVERLRNLVSKCLWRHVITPYSYLDEKYPLALLSWGCRLTMSYVNPTVVTRFIRKRALRGPEKNADDGQFDDGLLSRSNVVTDPVDSVLCP